MLTQTTLEHLRELKLDGMVRISLIVTGRFGST